MLIKLEIIMDMLSLSCLNILRAVMAVINVNVASFMCLISPLDAICHLIIKMEATPERI